MTLKQFLKPDWRKIVITIIIFILMPQPSVKCDGRGCNLTFIPFLILLYPSWFFEFFISFNNDLSTELGKEFNYELLYITLLIILISYLLSCLIVWIYDKSRKVKKK